VKTKSSVIDLTPVRREVVSPQEYLRLTKESPHLIAKSRFVTPSVGRGDFGKFEVEYSVPLLKRAKHG
jgi:hypothetical protein